MFAGFRFPGAAPRATRLSAIQGFFARRDTTGKMGIWCGDIDAKVPRLAIFPPPKKSAWETTFYLMNWIKDPIPLLMANSFRFSFPHICILSSCFIYPIYFGKVSEKLCICFYFMERFWTIYKWILIYFHVFSLKIFFKTYYNQRIKFLHSSLLQKFKYLTNFYLLCYGSICIFSKKILITWRY